MRKYYWDEKRLLERRKYIILADKYQINISELLKKEKSNRPMLHNGTKVQG